MPRIAAKPGVNDHSALDRPSGDKVALNVGLEPRMRGARFTVISSRRSPVHRFVVQQITKASPKANQPPPAEPRPSPQPGKAIVPSSWIAAPKLPGWLARVAGRKAADFPVSLPKAAAAGNTTSVAAHDINEYNWAGFFCPYFSASSFVDCRLGGHLACDGTAELRNGRRFHQCFCGGAGFISGAIETIGGNRHSVEAELGAAKPPASKSDGLTGKPAAIALPSPGKGGPPAKR
jgi:hypothetical protein